MPTKSGQWFRDDCDVAVRVTAEGRWSGLDDGGPLRRISVLFWHKPKPQAGFFTKHPVVDDGHWIEECVHPSKRPRAPDPSAVAGMVRDLTEQLDQANARIATLQSLRDTLAETIASGRLREMDIPDDYVALVRGIAATREGG